MHACSLHKKLELIEGSLVDYHTLSPYHYRDTTPGAVKAVFVLKPKRALGSFGSRAAGVIVYAMPNPRVELRRDATDGFFTGLDRQTALALINLNIRCIARVVVEPRFRGIGLATRLVRETMARMHVPIVEALGVMPKVNPFLEKAGMKVYAPRVSARHVQLIEALSVVGIEEDCLVDPDGVQERIDALPPAAQAFLETTINAFLQSHGRRRDMAPGLERTRYVLSKLTSRPAYYVWFNDSMGLIGPMGPISSIGS